MLKPKIQDALNEHLNEELFSAYLYMSMASYFEAKNLSGMAQWMKTQVQEELTHGVKFFDFVHDRGGQAILAEIAAPKSNWDSRINKLVDLAIAESDHALNTFLQWFVNEQVEEEATVEAIVDKLRMVGDNGVAMFMLDAELGKRTTMAAAE
jgi:ferritin